jgi:hypothetical protein
VIPSWIGLVILVIGFILYRYSLATLLAFLLASSLLAGSAAIFLPALGGSSITPAYVALGFVMAKVVLTPAYRLLALQALRENWLLVLFVGYGAMTAFLLPRIFAGQIYITPLRPPESNNPFATESLRPTSQNITTCIYLVGSLLITICAAVVARATKNVERLVVIFSYITIAHVLTGLLVLAMQLAGNTVLLDLIRNANYAQLTQDAGGFTRISGFFPETSSYSAFGVSLLVLMGECWIRDILPRRTGPTAVAMGVVLLISTSSTAYLGLGVYGLVSVLRIIFFPFGIGARKIATLLGFGIAAVFVGLAMSAALPRLVGTFVEVMLDMTVRKGESESGLQRAFWAAQGFDAFRVSYGLGIGAGSFRSSSLLTAIMGSLGVVGLVSFFLYVLVVFKPFNRSTYGRTLVPNGLAIDLGGACAVAALVGLAPEFFGSPAPIPGFWFSVLAGVSVSLRAGAGPAPERRHTPKTHRDPRIA